MKRWFQTIALSGLALILAAGATVAGEGGTWVSDTGNVHAIHANAVFVSDENAERFNLADLRDGETRTFGAGPRAVTVSRSGDEATISRRAGGDDVSAIDIACSLSEDTCTVLTFPDDAEKVMVAIEKERICVDGEGDCGDFAFGHHAGMEGHIVVDIDCEGDECGEFQAMHLEGLDELRDVIRVEATDAGDGEASRIVIRRVGGPEGDDKNVFVTSAGVGASGLHRIHEMHGNRVMLSCSEGDATLMVEKEEAEETFLCPKHSTPMEQIKHRGHGFRVIQKGEPHEH